MGTIPATPEEGVKMLFEVAEKGYPLEDIYAAVLGKADIDAKNASGDTPLLVATKRDNKRSHTDIIIDLLHRGADANIADTSGKTPLDHAMKKGNTKAMKELLDHKAKTSAELCEERGTSDGSCTIMGGKRRRNRTSKKTRKANKKRHTVRRRR
jgi:ankyrin repeat protein